MESNLSDKNMRDKLQSFEAPFDPQAWEQMESMLDEKKKRRGFFWWWFGGVAALVVLGLGTYGLMNHSAQKVAAITQLPVTNDRNLDHGPQTTDRRSSTIASQQETNPTKSEGANSTIASGNSSEIKSNSSGKDTKATSNAHGIASTSITAKGNTPKSAIGKQLSGQPDARPNASLRNSYKKIQRNKTEPALVSSTTNNEQQTKNVSGNRQSTAGNISASNEPQTTNTLSGNRQLATGNELTAFAMGIMGADKLPLQEETNGISSLQNDGGVVDTKKLKKHIFNYSVGAIANITGTTVGKQTDWEHPNRQAPLFYNHPSYAVGLTQEFLFLKRFAITNGILFSQTSFKIYQPETSNFSVRPLNYSSNITELQIPIGVKAYVVSKPKIRFYLQAGIINHIKLKETFTYKTAPDSNITAVPNALTGAFYPTQTDFSGNTKAVDANTQGVSSNYASTTSTADFSINHAKRYYASFYASAGVEFIVKKHLVLFTEPTFYMGLEKIGVQNKRKYNLGLSAGFRYEF